MTITQECEFGELPMKPMKTAGIVALMAVVAGSVFASGASAQNGALTGRVTEEGSGRALEGVTVSIVGTSFGAFTNATGGFLILSMPPGEYDVSASLVGYRAVEATAVVPADGAAELDFALRPAAIALDELVVTGAGVVTERRKLGNSVATINPASLEDAPVSDFSQLIAGREPGVVALPSSGYTGEGARIRVRGSASLTQLNEPVVYVDGIRVDRSAVATFNFQGNPSRLDDIPPESIERIEILKGAAAATLYGTEASNGVIQIFTKRGQIGAPRFTAQADLTGITVPTNRILPLADFAARACAQPGCMGPSDGAILEETITRMTDRWGQPIQAYEPVVRDLIPDMLSTGVGSTASASVSGGSEVFQYFLSGRIASEDGPYDAPRNFDPVEGLEPERDYNRRASITSSFTVLPTSDLRIGVTSLFSDMAHHTPDNSNNVYGVFTAALDMQLRLADSINYFGQPSFATLRENTYQRNFVNSQHFTGTTSIEYSPGRELRLVGTFGVDFTSDNAVDYRPYGWAVDGFSGSTPDGSRDVNEGRSRELTADIKGSYRIGGADIEHTLLVGTQGFVRQAQSVGGGGQDFPGPGLETLSALGSESSYETWIRVAQVGWYLQEQMSWRDWAFVTVGGRWDANSAFGSEFGTAFYPKVSLSVEPLRARGISSEALSTFRLRAAVGQSGLQPGAFDKFTTFSSQGSEAGPGVAPANLGNDKLKPEVSTEFEIGTEMGLWNDSWSLEATYWDRSGRDVLVDRQFPVTGGFIETQLDNIGAMEAHGLELSLRGSLVQRPGLSVTAFANTAYESQEITDLGGAPPLKTGGSYPRYRNYLVEGFTPGAFFGAKLAEEAIPLNILPPSAEGACVPPTLGNALEFFDQPRDPDEFKPLGVGNSDFGEPNGELASHNCGEGLLLSYLGKPTPDFAGSFGFTVAFAGNFELSSLMEYKLGHQVHDLSGMFRRANSYIGRNTPRAAELYATLLNPGSLPQERLDAAIAWAREIEGLLPMSGMNGIYDADWIQWRELSLVYRVPAELLERWLFSTATLSLGARNLRLFMLGDYPGMDPEGNVLGRCNEGLDCNFLDATEGWGIPVPRRVTLSGRVTF